jgi:UDP-N-acetylmuramate dehydrogenase
MDRKAREAVGKIVTAGRVLYDEPMSRYTSIGVGGPADLLVFPEDMDELMRLISCLKDYGITFMPIGNCTNLIVRDGGFRGAMISMKQLRRIDIDDTGRDTVGIAAEAGALLAQVLECAVGSSLAGLEFCAGIPGSVGGGIKMNAGAYGKELKDVIESVSFINEQGSVVELERERLPFEYRNLAVPEGMTITRAQFRLIKGHSDTIRENVSEILKIRRAKHPLEYRNAGSVFKNLPECPAGQLIDKAGMKGTREGGAQVSEKHGNFIVNRGHARAGDVISLMEIVQERVREKTGITLEPEVKIVGVDEES